METPLPEVYPSCDLPPDLPGPADDQRLCEDEVVKDKGSLEVSTPVDYTLPFLIQDGC